MKFLIHACPKRMWYVEKFLYPQLRDQGAPAEDIEIWNDAEGKGNQISFFESCAARAGDGGTWHIQDDVLLCRDFIKRCAELDDGVVYGFCCPAFTDDPAQIGRVALPDAWHSFQCVRIPDAYARECAAWYFDDARHRFIFHKWIASGKMDDSLFRAFLEDRHPDEIICNCAPNLVEHVDLLIGGSILSEWRSYCARSCYWDDEELILDLKNRIKALGR